MKFTKKLPGTVYRPCLTQEYSPSSLEYKRQTNCPESDLGRHINSDMDTPENDKNLDKPMMKVEYREEDKEEREDGQHAPSSKFHQHMSYVCIPEMLIQGTQAMVVLFKPLSP